MLRRTVMIALAGAALAAPAQAQLAGETLGAQYRFPAQGDVYTDHGSAVVGAGVEFTGVGGGILNIDLFSTGMFLDFTASGTFATTGFNGIRVYDFAGTAPTFSGFFVTGTNVAGLDNSRLSFDGNNLWVNFSGLSIDGNSQAEFGVNAVPEPASMTLMATGLVGLVGAARRRRNAKIAA